MVKGNRCAGTFSVPGLCCHKWREAARAQDGRPSFLGAITSKGSGCRCPLEHVSYRAQHWALSLRVETSGGALPPSGALHGWGTAQVWGLPPLSSIAPPHSRPGLAPKIPLLAFLALRFREFRGLKQKSLNLTLSPDPQRGPREGLGCSLRFSGQGEEGKEGNVGRWELRTLCVSLPHVRTYVLNNTDVTFAA